jgi:hypothetical protein
MQPQSSGGFGVSASKPKDHHLNLYLNTAFIILGCRTQVSVGR